MPAESDLPEGERSSAGAGVVPVNATFDDGAIDRFVRCVSEACEKHGRLIIDARHNQWLDPGGLVSLFIVGDWLRDRGFPKAQLLLPRNADTRGYWRRMGVVEYAGDYFDVSGDLTPFEGGRDGPLIPLTRLEASTDFSVGENPQRDLFGRVIDLLRSKLGLGGAVAMTTAIELSEVSSEMMSETGRAVWFSAQTYSWRARLGRRVVLCAFGCHAYRPRAALEERHASRYGSRWDDATALEATLLHGSTRFSATRPRGLGALRRAATRLDGKLTVRSGTARICMVPSWDQGEPMATDLPEYPGTLLTLTTPAPGMVER
jgi:hypothetical protein